MNFWDGIADGAIQTGIPRWPSWGRFEWPDRQFRHHRIIAHCIRASRFSAWHRPTRRSPTRVSTNTSDASAFIPTRTTLMRPLPSAMRVRLSSRPMPTLLLGNAIAGAIDRKLRHPRQAYGADNVQAVIVNDGLIYRCHRPCGCHDGSRDGYGAYTNRNLPGCEWSGFGEFRQRQADQFRAAEYRCSATASGLDHAFASASISGNGITQNANAADDASGGDHQQRLLGIVRVRTCGCTMAMRRPMRSSTQVFPRRRPPTRPTASSRSTIPIRFLEIVAHADGFRDSGLPMHRQRSTPASISRPGAPIARARA